MVLAPERLDHQLALLGVAVVERLAHAPGGFVRVDYFVRVGADGLGIDADRQHGAVAVEDGSPLRGRLHRLELLLFGALDQELLVPHLQVEQARLDPDRPGGEQDREHEQRVRAGPGATRTAPAPARAAPPAGRAASREA